MAKVIFSGALPRIQGKFGDGIYKWYNGVCVRQRLPQRRKNRRISAREAATRDNLRQAVTYAQSVIADPAAKAYYAAAARKLRRSVYIVAKADAMKAPEIRLPRLAQAYQGRAGEQLMIDTGDLFRVQTLRITVRDAAGDIVETGEARRSRKTFFYPWKRDHPRKQLLTIEVLAESRAGRRTIVTEKVRAG
jgi:hypothetical protein